MSKYNKGDKFELEIAEVFIGETDKEIYRVKGFAALTFDDYGLSLLKQIKPEEAEVDWSKVKVDTPILVRSYTDSKWHRRYFAKYEDGKIHAWGNGRTSWSTGGVTICWPYAKLAEVE